MAFGNENVTKDISLLFTILLIIFWLQVLELTGYKLSHGADFKMFSVLAALSQRISALE